MIELAAELGYHGVAVRDLVSTAKVSSRSFYTHFTGKEDCFLRAHDVVARRLAKRVAAAQAGERDWRGRLRLGLGALTSWLASDPRASTLLLVEAHRATPAARARSKDAARRFEAMLTEGFARAPGGATSPILAEGIVAGVAEVARRRLLSTRPWDPVDLADDLFDWVMRCRDHEISSAIAGSSFLPSDGSPSLPSSMAAVGSRSIMADRDLILAAVVKLATSEKQARLTASTVRAAAGVSRPRFAAHFDGIEDCLVAAIGRRVDEAVARSARARGAAADAADGKVGAVLALCADLASDSDLYDLCLVEAAADCDPTASLFDCMTGGVLALFTPGPLLRDERAMPVPMIASSAAIAAIAQRRIVSGEGEGLLAAEPKVVALATAGLTEVKSSAPENLTDCSSGSMLRLARGLSGQWEQGNKRTKGRG
jgi:AcrR family transcriptional regulator